MRALGLLELDKEKKRAGVRQSFMVKENQKPGG